MLYTKTLNQIKQESLFDINQLKHIKFEKHDNQYKATLVDSSGYEIVRGYGDSVIESINDLHSCIL